jgi:hypothetical protein
MAAKESVENWLNEFLRLVRDMLLYKLTELSDCSVWQNKLEETIEERYSELEFFE